VLTVYHGGVLGGPKEKEEADAGAFTDEWEAALVMRMSCVV